MEDISSLFVVFAFLLFASLPASVPSLSVGAHAIVSIWRAVFFFFFSPLLHPLLKQQLASKTPGYLLSNTFSHKDFSLYKYIYTCSPPLLKMWFTRKGRGRRQEGEGKIMKGNHEEKFTFVAFHLLITWVWNEIEKNVVSTSQHTISIYKGDLICFIYYKTRFFKCHIWLLIKRNVYSWILIYSCWTSLIRQICATLAMHRSKGGKSFSLPESVFLFSYLILQHSSNSLWIEPLGKVWSLQAEIHLWQVVTKVTFITSATQVTFLDAVRWQI